MPCLTSSSDSFVATDDEVPQDVFGELDGSLEFACLGRGQRVLEDGVLAVTVAADLVCEAAAHRWPDLLDLAAEGADRLLQAVADRGEALLVRGGLDEIHELLWTHEVSPPPFPGIAAGRIALLRGGDESAWPGAKRDRGSRRGRWIKCTRS